MEQPIIPAQLLSEPGAEVQSDAELGIIATFAHELISLDKRIERAEKELDALKSRRKQVSETEIPDRLAGLGLSDFTTVDGYKLSIAPFYQASIKRINDERGGMYEPGAFKWLEDNGHGGAIKNEINVPLGRGEEVLDQARRVVDVLRTSYHMPATLEQSVHAMTLKSLARELAERGDTLPPEYFNTYTGRQTKIKAPRQPKF